VALAVLVALGCGRNTPVAPKTTTLTAAQETAVLEYSKQLEQHLDLLEQSVAILASVQSDRESRDEAKSRLVQQSLAIDAHNVKMRQSAPTDPRVLVAAHNRVVERQSVVQQKLRAEVSRIVNQVDGGKDFFEKELRPLLAATHNSGSTP